MQIKSFFHSAPKKKRRRRSKSFFFQINRSTISNIFTHIHKNVKLQNSISFRIVNFVKNFTCVSSQVVTGVYLFESSGITEISEDRLF